MKRYKCQLLIPAILLLIMLCGCDTSHSKGEDQTTQAKEIQDTSETDQTNSEFQSLHIDTVYEFDLDGDGEEDSFKYTYGDEEGQGYFIVNGQKYPVFIARGIRDLYYYSYSKDDTYIIYTYGQFGGNTTPVCRFTGKEFEELMDFNVLDRDILLDSKGKEIYLETSYYHPNNFMGINEVSSDKPDIAFKATYVLDTEKHTFVRKNRICDAMEDYELIYTGEDYTVSDSDTDINQNGFTLSKGDKVRLSSISYEYEKDTSNDVIYGLIKDDETGWINKEMDDNISFDY